VETVFIRVNNHVWPPLVGMEWAQRDHAILSGLSQLETLANEVLGERQTLANFA
jgi:hypothetical protein